MRQLLPLHYFRLWRELRLYLIRRIKMFGLNTFILHYFRLWRELRLPYNSICCIDSEGEYCTISVYEGNYDQILLFLSYHPPFKYCTISVYEGNYDTTLLFFCFKLNSNCTISVYEGNYDPIAQFVAYSQMGCIIALFPFMKGITTNKVCNSLW